MPALHVSVDIASSAPINSALLLATENHFFLAMSAVGQVAAQIKDFDLDTIDDFLNALRTAHVLLISLLPRFRRAHNALLKPTDAPAITASPRIMPAPPSALSVEPLTRSRSCLTEPPTATARHHTAAQRAHARA